MLLLAGKVDSLDQAKQEATAVCQDGRSLAKFRAMVTAQGGPANMIDDPDSLPQAPLKEAVYSERGGVIAGIDAGVIGWSCVQLGGGRQVKSDIIDHAVGMVIPVKVGQMLEAGDLLGTIHANDPAKLKQARTKLQQAVSWSNEHVPPLPHIYETVT
jgi:pyrimidine-nucleoside phosphorylase